MQTFYFTDPGKVRSHNEDSVIIISNDHNEYILAVADGMGGHKAGEVASAIATNHIRESFYSLETMGTKEEAIDWLRMVVKEINDQIFEYADKNPRRCELLWIFLLVMRIFMNFYGIMTEKTCNKLWNIV